MYSIIALIGLLSIQNLYAHRDFYSHGELCSTGMQAFNEYRLFFGRNHDNTGTQIVSHIAWEEFVAQEITPRFPEGLSVLDVQGQFMNQTGSLIKENTKMVLILIPLLPVGGIDPMKLIDEIMQAYSKKFQRTFFLRTHNITCVKIGY